MSHSDLWPLYLTILIPQLILTLIVYLMMFVTFFPFYGLFLTLWGGPVGFIYSGIVVLQQSGFVSVFIVTFVLMPEIQRVAFDAVLSKECPNDIVLLGKLRRVNAVPYMVNCIGIVFAVPQLLVLPYLVFKLALMFAVSVIPVIGPVLVILLQAPSKGIQAHGRYFSLLGYDTTKIAAVYYANNGAYLGFGLVATILESIPIISLFFMFTNTIGAAIWVSNIEKSRPRRM